jgi:predicted nucleic acid-binding protein
MAIKTVLFGFVRLEVLPKARFFDRTAKVDFYKAFFEQVEIWAPLDATLVRRALDEAVRHGLGAIDALLLVSAASVGAEFFVTTEAKSKPIHRTDLIKVVSLTP